jgi:hypothetical protein
LLNGIASKSTLVARGVLLNNNDVLCVLCKKDEETTNHLFFSCKH